MGQQRPNFIDLDRMQNEVRFRQHLNLECKGAEDILPGIFNKYHHKVQCLFWCSGLYASMTNRDMWGVIIIIIIGPTALSPPKCKITEALNLKPRHIEESLSIGEYTRWDTKAELERIRDQTGGWSGDITVLRKGFDGQGSTGSEGFKLGVNPDKYTEDSVNCHLNGF